LYEQSKQYIRNVHESEKERENVWFEAISIRHMNHLLYYERVRIEEISRARKKVSYVLKTNCSSLVRRFILFHFFFKMLISEKSPHRRLISFVRPPLFIHLPAPRLTQTMNQLFKRQTLTPSRYS